MIATSVGRMRGFSLVELAVTLVAIGLVSLVLVQFLGTATLQRSEAAGRDLLQRADDALLAFAMVNSRLPCPAAPGTGVEDCALGQVGLLPYRTIGLPDAGARRIRYGVLRRPDDRKLDADLARAIDRFDPMQVLGGGLTTEFPLGNANGIDLCWALRTAQAAPTDAAFLHVTRPDAPTTLADHVAYAVALPAPGRSFGGRQATNAPAFDSPRRRANPDHADRVLAVGLDQLWTRMRCGETLATASHAHFNAAAAITVVHTALRDYRSQLAIALKLAEANVDSGAAAVLNGVAGTASAAGGTADTISEGLASTGIVAYRVALGVVATIAAVAVTATAGALVAASVEARDKAEEVHDCVDDGGNPIPGCIVELIDDARALEPVILQNAQTADAIGLY